MEPRSTNDSRAQETPRGMVAYRESTRDPIFLFQTLDYGCSEHDYSAMEDLGWKCDEGWYTENGEPVTPEMMEDHDIGTRHWDTKRVFLHREEARRYGQSRPYAWGEEGKGWRVYCVCAEGELAQLLLRAGDYDGHEAEKET